MYALNVTFPFFAMLPIDITRKNIKIFDKGYHVNLVNEYNLRQHQTKFHITAEQRELEDKALQKRE